MYRRRAARSSNDEDRIGFSLSRPVLTTILLCLFITGCSTSEFDREDAVGMFMSTGASEAEASCLADSLVATGQLHTADPRLDPTDTGREAYLDARNRCLDTDVLSVSVDRVQYPSSHEPDSYQEPAPGPDSSSVLDPGIAAPEGNQVADASQDEAIAALVRQGRTSENASCIVEQLVALHAEYLFDEPSFGVGLDPLEAHATAACI